MKKESDLRRGRHCVFRMHVHLVFVTKYRRNVFTKEVLDDLKIFFEKVCLDFESELVEFAVALFILALNGEVFRATPQ